MTGSPLGWPRSPASTLRQWVYEWSATVKHRLQVRAEDGNDDVQIEFEAPPAPDDATRWQTIEVTVG